jgi:hypothetical protein
MDHGAIQRNQSTPLRRLHACGLIALSPSSTHPQRCYGFRQESTHLEVRPPGWGVHEDRSRGPISRGL